MHPKLIFSGDTVIIKLMTNIEIWQIGDDFNSPK